MTDDLIICDVCDGTGEVHSHNPRCWECGGRGKILKSKYDFRKRMESDSRINDEVIAAIQRERRRQCAKGQTTEHDDTHTDQSIAQAAAVYAMPVSLRDKRLWPWEMDSYKPCDRYTELVKAGALIVAEIERMKRIEMQAQSRALEANNDTD